MQNQNQALGQVYLSRSGRDKGEHLVAVREEGEYLYLCNGRSRPLQKPKKKKRKHTQATGWLLPSIGAKLAAGQKIFDAELKSALDQELRVKLGGQPTGGEEGKV